MVLLVVLVQLLLIFAAVVALFLTILAATSPVLGSFILQFRLQKEPSILKSGSCGRGAGVVGPAVTAVPPTLLFSKNTSASQLLWQCRLPWWLPSSSSTDADIGLLIVNTLFVDDDNEVFVVDLDLLPLVVVFVPHPLSSSPPLYPFH